MIGMIKDSILIAAVLLMSYVSAHAQVDTEVPAVEDPSMIIEAPEAGVPAPPPPPPPPVLGDEPAFPTAEEMPRFPGCEEIGDPKEKADCSKQKMMEFIYDNLVYPEEAKAAGVEGMTVVQFVVAEDGKISDTKVVRDIGYGCGAEAVKVVQKMKSLDARWVPSQSSRGRAIKVLYTLPVRFELPKE